MDGTGDLFAAFAAELPSELGARVVAYDRRRPASYSELVDHVLSRLDGAPCALVAESFSGPLAIRVASLRPTGLVALVLVATFARRPRAIPPPPASLVKLVPRWLVRALLLGGDAPDRLTDAVAAAIAEVEPAVLGARLRELLRVDVRGELGTLDLPVLWLSARGDRLVPASATREVRALRPDFSFLELDGPHLLLQRRPDHAAGAIADFLRPIAARAV